MYIESDCNPLVSVVIPSYNRAHLLLKTIESVLMQRIASLEIVVADDGSTDNTKDIIKQLQLIYPFVSYVENAVNLGEAAARNLGIKNAKGKYLAFLDSDDEWLENKLSLQIDFLEKNFSEYDAVATNYYLVDSNGQKEEVVSWFPKKPLTSLNLLKYGCNVSFGSTVCVRRDVFDSIGFLDESLPIFVDLDWLCRFCEKGFKMAKIEQCLVNYNKAPMRRGEFLEEGVVAFKKINFSLLSSFSLKDRFYIQSQFYNYVSLAYLPHGPFNKFFKSRMLHFLFNPFRHIGNYWHFFKVVTQHFLRKSI